MGRVHTEWTPFISLIGLSQAVYKVSIFQKKAQDYEVLGSFDTALDFLTFAPCTFVRHALYNLDLKRHFLFFSSQNRPLHWDGPRAALKRDPFIFFVSISLHMFASECTSLTSIRIKIIWFTYFVLVTSNIENVPVPFWTKSTQWHIYKKGINIVSQQQIRLRFGLPC